MEKTYHILKIGDGKTNKDNNNTTNRCYYFLEKNCFIKYFCYNEHRRVQMEKTIELLKKYFCMAKLTTNLEGPTEETIECYIPSVCYLINLSIKGMEDKSIIMYTRDPYTLEPLSEENNIPIIVPSQEVSDDYEKIKRLCVQKNQELLQAQVEPILDTYAEYFRQNEINCFKTCYEPLIETPKTKPKERRK